LAVVALGPLVVLAQTRTYAVSWLGLPVVDVTITHSQEDCLRQSHYQARTRPWFSSFYSVDNQYWIFQDTLGGQLVRYRKQIRERNRRREFEAQYRFDIGQVVYANGATRSLEPGDQGLFSALQWVESNSWETGQQRELVVEVEGVFWLVSAWCEEVRQRADSVSTVARVTARFERQLRGEPVLSSTDLLTALLPGQGHELRFELDLERRLILSLEFGSLPFVVRARLVPEG
jgi:hypothetical protein